MTYCHLIHNSNDRTVTGHLQPVSNPDGRLDGQWALMRHTTVCVNDAVRHAPKYIAMGRVMDGQRRSLQTFIDHVIPEFS